MNFDITEKVNEIFSEELNDNKKLLFSPKKQIHINFNKNIQDNQISLLGKIEKSMENIDQNGNAHIKKSHSKKMRENNNYKGSPYSNNDLNFLSNNNLKNDDKNINHLNEKKNHNNNEVKEEKDIKNNNDNIDNNNIFDDEDYPFNLKKPRARGRSYHEKNRLASASCFRGILSKDSKKLKKPKFDLDKEIEKNEKIVEKKEEEDLKHHEEDISISKEKKRKISSNSKSFSTHKIKKNRLELNKEIKEEKKNKSINMDSLDSEENQSPKSKSKKRKKKEKTTKSIKSELKEKKLKEKIKKYNSILDQNKIVSPPLNKKVDNNKEISSYNSSKISDDTKTILDNKNNERKISDKEQIKNNKNENSDDSNFRSSNFSNESQSNDDLYIHKKNMPKSYKSSKYIKFYDNNNLNNNKRKKSSNKKFNNKNEELNHEKKEESKSNSKFIKDNLDKIDNNETSKIKSFKLDDEKEKNSEPKLKRGNSKRIVNIPFDYQISHKVNNLIILSEQENKNLNEQKNIHQNMNVISPGNYISIEYNINHGKKNERNLEIKNNHNLNNNGDTNNITCYRKEAQNKNDLIEIKKELQQNINEDDNIVKKNTSGYNEFINSNSSIIKGKKKPKKTFCFCCL